MTVHRTTISWTHSTWNPVSGCTKVSAGCDNCYAETISRRFRRLPFEEITLHPERLAAAQRFRPLVADGSPIPRMVFVNSMSDLFHERIPAAFQHQVFDAMEANSQTIFQVLTKRPGLMGRFLKARHGAGRLSRNIWLGVSIEDDRVRKRIDVLRDIGERFEPACLFLSVEPLIGPIGDCDFAGMDWVLIGGESGPKCREMKGAWLDAAITKACQAKAAIWFKQFGHPRNNPGVVKKMRENSVGIGEAFHLVVRDGLELAPEEKGGATYRGRLLRELPRAWHEQKGRLR